MTSLVTDLVAAVGVERGYGAGIGVRIVPLVSRRTGA
jgi:hypothetical protein